MEYPCMLTGMWATLLSPVSVNWELDLEIPVDSHKDTAVRNGLRIASIGTKGKALFLVISY